GGGGGPSPVQRQLPELAVAFPSSGSVATSAQITVRGTVSEPVAGVDVNGRTAASSDGFRSWTAAEVLSEGASEFEVAYREVAGDAPVPAARVSVRRLGSLLEDAVSLHIGPDGRALVFDRGLEAVIEIDADGAASRVVTGAGRGLGPALGAVSDAVYDEAGTGLYVLTPPDRAFHVDLVTGDRTELLDTSGLQFLWSPGAVVLDAPGRRLLVASGLYNHIVAISLDPPSLGRRRLVSGDTLGSGPGLRRADDLALDASGTRALVISYDTDRVVAVDLVDLGAGPGHRTTVATVDRPRFVAVDPLTQRVFVVDDLLALREVTALGDTRVVSGGQNAVGAGPALRRPAGVAVVPGSPHPIVLDADRGELLEVDVDTGERRSRHRAAAGSGPELRTPVAIVGDPAAGRALVLQRTAPQLVAVAFADGARTALTQNAFEAPRAFAVEQGRRRALVLDLDGLYAVDLDSGAAVELTPRLGGPGAPRFAHIAVDEERLLAIVATDAEVWTVDLATLVAERRSGGGFGAGPAFADLRGLVADPARGRALVCAQVPGGRALVAVDLASGDRTLVSGPGLGGGPALVAGPGVLLDAGADAVLALDPRELVRIDLATGDRAAVTGGSAGAVGLCLGATPSVVLVLDDLLQGVLAFDRQGNQQVLLSR
ncbi:MAG: hypothetical protein AB7O84_24585, partial [Planctomycetota bacterium]